MEHQSTTQMRSKSMHLLDIDRSLIVSIFRVLPVRDKLQLRLVCKTFYELLDDPTRGGGLWGVIELHGFTVDKTTYDPLSRHVLSRNRLSVTR